MSEDNIGQNVSIVQELLYVASPRVSDSDILWANSEQWLVNID
jgi:hypothetical protein